MLSFAFASLDDEAIGGLVFASGLESLGQLSPRTHRMMTPASTFALSLSTAHGMIDWIHDHAPDVGRRPSQRVRPAFPLETFMWSVLPT